MVALEMLVGLLISWAVLAVAFAVTTWLLSGMEVSGGFWGYVGYRCSSGS